MPIKASDLLKQIFEPLGLKNQDIDAALSASGLKDVEFPDVAKDKFNENYLTIDRAAADEKVLAKARGAVYSMTEQRLSKKVRALLTEADQKAYDEAPQLFDKIDYLEKALENIKSAPNDDVKKVQETWRKKEAEYHDKIKLLEDNAKKTEAEKAAEVQSIKMDYVLRSKLAGIEFAPEYADPEFKESIANSNIDFLKKNFVLEFDLKNPSVVNLRKSVDGAIVDVYEYEGKPKDDKKAYTLDEVISKRFEKWTKKNNAGATGKEQNQPPAPPKLQIPSDKPLSLSDMHKQAAGATA